MGVKLGKALGAEVVVFTTSPKKKEDALRLGQPPQTMSAQVFGAYAAAWLVASTLAP